MQEHKDAHHMLIKYNYVESKLLRIINLSGWQHIESNSTVSEQPAFFALFLRALVLLRTPSRGFSLPLSSLLLVMHQSGIRGEQCFTVTSIERQVERVTR
jgi:hypothetical protein